MSAWPGKVDVSIRAEHKSFTEHFRPMIKHIENLEKERVHAVEKEKAKEDPRRQMLRRIKFYSALYMVAGSALLSGFVESLSAARFAAATFNAVLFCLMVPVWLSQMQMEFVAYGVIVTMDKDQKTSGNGELRS